MPILFPFTWEKLQYGIIPVDDYNITIIAILLALAVYCLIITNKKIKKDNI